MPTPGRDWGIDSATKLKDLPWAAIRPWRPPHLVFAGRYFHPGHVWENNEAKGVKHGDGGNPALNPNLAYVFPLQGPGVAGPYRRVQGLKANGDPEDAETVQQWGAEDANKTCTKIIQVVQSGDLTMPSSNFVIVYLDVEPTDETAAHKPVILSPNYWYGWASKVYWFSYVSSSFPFVHFPFYPGLYCATVCAAFATRTHCIPSTNVQDGLTKPPNNLASVCYGVYAANPQVPPNSNDRFAVNFQPDWTDRFDDWQQTVHIIFGLVPWNTKVPVRMWQYAAGPNPAIDALQVDFNETSPVADAVKRMLLVP